MATLASQQPFPLPPPTLEVRCAGCDETLEVEPGLTEFICPDCHTPQALPPELLPRKRKALPLPRGVDSRKAQLPCASCNALLNVPHGLSRFSCPQCGVELAVDHERLKGYFAGSSAAAAAVPSAVRLPQPIEVEPPILIDAVATSTMAPVVSTAYAEKNQRCVSSREPVSIINVNHINARTPSRTPALTHVNSEQNNTLILMKEPGLTSVNAEQVVVGELALTSPTTGSISNRSKRGRKQAGPTAATASSFPDVTDPNLRRSKRLAKSPAVSNTSKQTPSGKKIKEKQVTSSPGQSQPSQSQLDQTEQAESRLEPQDIARHYNEFFSMDTRQLYADSPGPHLGPDPNSSPDSLLDPHSDPCQNLDMALDETVSDDDKDKRYVAEPDSSSDCSDNELDKSEPDPAALKALLHAQKRNGYFRKGRESKCRGPNRCLEVWNRPDDDPIEVEFNHLGQPVGKESYTLKHFLGTIARDGKLTPLNFIDWRSVPTDCKDTIWFIVKSKFKLEQIRKKYIMKATGTYWSHWKSIIKRLHYDIHDNDEARLADIDERIIPEQWSFLVHYWSSEEGQKKSANGRKSRKFVKAMHTLGSKSYAQLREEERLKKPNKELPSRAEMFILSHTRKDGTPVNEESAQIIAKLQEKLKVAEPSEDANHQNDLLAKVLGKKKRGSYILTYGLLPGKRDSLIQGGTSSKEGKERIVAEARQLADKETKPLKDKIETMEKRHKEMEEEMGKMRDTIASMLSAQQGMPNQPGLPLGFSGDR